MKTGFNILVVIAFLVVGYTPSLEAAYKKDDWAASVSIGVSPSIFTKKGKFTNTVALQGNPLPVDEIADINNNQVRQCSENFEFHNIYHMPVYLAGSVGNFVSDLVEVFADLTFMHANAKKFVMLRPSEGTNLAPQFRRHAFWKPGNLNRLAIHVGARKYFDNWCLGELMPFAGGKIGVVLTSSAKRGIYSHAIQGLTSQMFFKRASECKSAFSVGAQWGFDWMASECIGLTFMSESILTTGKIFKSGRQFHPQGEFRTGAIHSNVSVNPKAMISFPVTIGLRVHM